MRFINWIATPALLARNEGLSRHTERSEVSKNIDSESATIADSSPSLAELPTLSPSLAEGARGWVSLRGNAEAIHNQNMDCHEFSSKNSRNDEIKDTSVATLPQYDTHPLTPSAREGE